MIFSVPTAAFPLSQSRHTTAVAAAFPPSVMIHNLSVRFRNYSLALPSRLDMSLQPLSPCRRCSCRHPTLPRALVALQTGWV